MAVTRNTNFNARLLEPFAKSFNSTVVSQPCLGKSGKANKTRLLIGCIRGSAGYDVFHTDIPCGAKQMPQSPAPSRRDFLKASAAGAISVAATGISTGSPQRTLGNARSCIFINMVGGPGHLDTFDPKPEAPAEFRGPFRPIQTKVPGLHLSELFPKLATVTDKISLIRSMHHTAPPIHECGFQLLNTGRLFRDGPEWPNVGAVVSFLRKERPAWIVPTLNLNTGVSISHGLGSAHLRREPRVWEGGSASVPGSSNSRFGDSEFGKNTAWAAATSLLGEPFVILNMYSTFFDSLSWDCHADGGSLCTDLNDIRDSVAPSFDNAFASLIENLEERGSLDSTLVVATGEFGRTPLLNSNGGRDHWAGAWTALVAGGGIKGGQVIGRTDAKGTEPADRPVTPQELVATIFHALGIPPDATIPGPAGSPVAAYPGKPISELF
jgi:hypothetical protein